MIDRSRRALTGVAARARAVVVVDQVDAGGTVLAAAHAVVQVLGARRTAPALLAGALERAGQVAARLGVDARPEAAGRGVRFALVDICGKEEKRCLKNCLGGERNARGAGHSPI